MEHHCDCEVAGYCPLFKRNMTERMHSICRGEVLTEEKRLAYVRIWLKAIGKDSPLPPEKRICYDWPCVHRGEKTGETLDCRCVTPEPVYFCNSPNSEIRECVIRKTKAGRILPNVCAKCPVREEPT